jgi:soluble lytic murein transglycosylase
MFHHYSYCIDALLASINLSMGTLIRLFIVIIAIGGLAERAEASAFAKSIAKREWFYAEKVAGNDQSLRTYAQWRRLKDYYSDASFDELSRFISRNPGWPDQNLLRQRAEKLLFVEYRKEDSANWLAKYPPISGYGKLALARLKKGDITALVKDGWINGDFDAPDERKILNEFRSYLTTTDHMARIVRLLKDDRASIADRHLYLVDDAHQRLFQARIALIRFDSGVEGKINRVPSAMMNDDGLTADRARWRAKKGLDDGVLELLRKMSPTSHYASKLWQIRAWHVRDFIESKQYDKALQLLEGAGKLDTAFNADMLWLKGWIYLEYRHAPGKAYAAFTEMYKGVSYPVSKARAAYWAARAAEKLGHPQDVDRWYREGAKYPTVFYGQLAHAQIHKGKPLQFPAPPVVASAVIDRYSSNPVFVAARRLTALGEHHLADELISHLGDTVDTPVEAAALVSACAKAGMPLAQVRAIKAALKQNVMLVKEGWPTIQLGVAIPIETPLAFAISRQESEFNPKAVSSADARGLMQILPSTAKIVARQMKMPFDASRLYEPAYNLKLGGWYLGSLIDKFRGSYILAIAGYNAGPGRSVKWVGRFGRPGGELRDTVNWIETIPFAETRNYVQRVLENLQVYRAVMNPQQPLMIEADLLR